MGPRRRKTRTSRTFRWRLTRTGEGWYPTSMQGLRTLIFDVTNLDGAKAFYTAALGHGPYFDEPFYVGFDVQGYELGLRPTEAGRGAGGGTAYLGTDDVDREVARLLALGATVREAPEDVGGGIRVATLIDPFGNALGVISNPAFAPTWVSAREGDVADRTIVHSETVPLPRAEVWPLWTSAAGVTRWLVDEAKIELRVGGLYELYFMGDAPLGKRGSETCRVLSFVPGRMVSFTWNAPPHLDKTRSEHTWVVIELEEAGPSSTKVTVTHTGWPASGLVGEPQWEATFVYFDRAWQGVLAALRHFAETGTKKTD